MNSDLSTMLNKVYDLCDEQDAMGLGMSGVKTRDLQQVEFISCALYFAKADGEISDEDESFFQKYLNPNMTKEMISNVYEMIINDPLAKSRGDYADNVPPSILTQVEKDNKVYASSNDDTKSVAAAVAAVFNLIGKELVKDADDDVKSKFEAYITRIVDYIHENLAYDYRLDLE